MPTHHSREQVERRQGARNARRYWPLTVHLATIYTGLVAVACAVVGWIGYSHTANLAVAAAHDRFERIGRETRATVERLYLPIESLVATLAHHPITTATALKERLAGLPLLVAALERNTTVSAVYVGYDDGSFFLVRPLRDAAARSALDAPPAAAYAVQSVERRGARVRGRYLFYDAALHPITAEERPEYAYDPRTRPWYAAARADAPALVRTDPYVFFTTAEIGKTFAVAAADGGAVVGADVTLNELSRSLAAQQVSPGSVAAVFDATGAMVAMPESSRLVTKAADGGMRRTRVAELGMPVLESLFAAAQQGRLGTDLSLQADGAPWAGLVFELRGRGDRSNYLAVATPEAELLSAARRSLQQTGLLTLAAVVVAVLLTVGASRLVSRPLEILADEARAIRRFRLEGDDAVVESPVREVHVLAEGTASMKRTLRNFLDISASLSGEHRLDRLLERVAQEAVSASRAAGAVVFVLSEDERSLHAGASRVPRLAQRGIEQAMQLNMDGDDLLAVAARSGRVVQTALDVGHWPASLAALQEASGLDAAALLALPLRSRRGDLVGLLALVRPATQPWPGELVSFVEAVSGSAAVAIENQRLFDAQKNLLDALIRLLAGAIDAKSPYTGGHCQRVPELTFMLARAACQVQEGPLAGFSLDDDEWEALRVAAWLHDCGKVTTPEYVVDKATKLETLYDRIHEVRMRFEVLKRDAEVRCWQSIAAGEAAETAQTRLAGAWQTLDEEFAFVAACNPGSEAMPPDATARLQQIGRRTWRRTLDDRIGISREELRRKNADGVPTLPVEEPLLADKPEHLVPRSADESIPPDNPWGFRMEEPEYKYHRGELHNLSQLRGTLTDEDRYVINHHIVETIVMLSQLPFPKHLRSVPELAGGHHEKMDGTGYPKRLTREQMSWPARMMAIADIFEALTAADRPYKHGKTLSESLAIMARMRDRQHIDPDLFDLFLDTGIWRDYAQRFLTPEQIDEVDAARYRSGPAAAHDRRAATV